MFIIYVVKDKQNEASIERRATLKRHGNKEYAKKKDDGNLTSFVFTVRQGHRRKMLIISEKEKTKLSFCVGRLAVVER